MRIKFFTLIVLISILEAQVAESTAQEVYTPKPRPSPISTYDGEFIDSDLERANQKEYNDAWVLKGNKNPPPPALIPGESDWVETRFQMPIEEILVGCLYAPGNSFPSSCGENGKKTFDIGKDSQEVLDQIVREQGKQGKYNKIPPGYLENLRKELGEVTIIDPGVPYTIKPSVADSKD